ncbi:MAG: DUF4838 domain-containing protein, partial [Clostridia bacterium]|nr:DUF4838 domain-containing protein [Clostridia bacterium]
QNGKGYIAGSNPRSVLFGVYEYLKSCGCRFIRPGKDGDFIPQFDISNHSFKRTHKASMRFRGQMIEGAVSVEHTLDSVDFMAKNGYNSFFIQFVHPYGFYRRWYEHQYSKTKQNENISFAEMEEFTYRIEKAIKKRGMLLHNLGHGFFFEPFGLRHYGPNTKPTLPEEAKPYVAMVDGKRDIHGGSINYTQLCYSNPKVRKMLVEYLLQYMQERPLTDILHIYFADAANNHCECDECRKLIPSDYYIMLLNELDEAFTQKGLDTKILLLMYVDLLWPPLKTKIKNPDRFVSCAAISRDYNSRLPEKKTRKIPEYVLNNYNPFRGEAKTTIDFVEAWKPHFDKPFIAMTYDMYADHFYDPGHFQISARIAQDMKDWHMYNGNGILDCQTMRYGFPTALPNAVEAAFSMDNALDFETFTNDYFEGAYGKDWEKAKAYLKEITNLFSPCSLRLSEDIVVQDTDENADVDIQKSYIGNPEAQARLKQVAAFVDSFMPTVENHLNEQNPCHKISWEYLKYHGEFCKRYAEIFYNFSEKDVETAYINVENMMQWLSETEDIFGRHFDMFLLNLRILRLTVIRMRRKLGLPETITLHE